MKAAAIVGSGPSGLMAAEVLSQAGFAVDVYDAMASPGRKFLLAGRGGMNLTHSEPFDAFVARYGPARAALEPLLHEFGAAQVCAWVQGLGIATFVGTSGRVFPTEMKAAPLLRAWLHRLRGAGVRFHMRHRWLGWGEAAASDGRQPLQFAVGRAAAPGDDAGAVPILERQFDALVLALGGGSWAKLGSDGAWLPLLLERGVEVAPLLPANCGFDVAVGQRLGWSEHFRARFAGVPFKSVAISCIDAAGHTWRRKGEFVATETGVEGSLIYAASGLLRDAIMAAATTALQHSARAADGGPPDSGAPQGTAVALPGAVLLVDLLPDHAADAVRREVQHPRGSRSLSSHLKSRLGLQGIKMALLHELLSAEDLHDPLRLARSIKALPLRVVAPRPLDEAISSAGGVRFAALNADLMLQRLPGVFCAGEMLDWEAPTGGYLLTACLASGYRAGQGVVRFLHA